MRLALLAAAAAMSYGCSTSPKPNLPTSGATPESRSTTALREATITPEPKYSLQRPGGEKLIGVGRQAGHFSTPYVVVGSADRSALHRFQASTGTYQDEFGLDLPDRKTLGRPQALAAFAQEFWVADGTSGTLHQFHGFDPRYVESLTHAALQSPIVQLHVAGGKSGRLLFILDRHGDQLKLHRFETRLRRAPAPDQPDRIQLDELTSLDLGQLQGVPSLLFDADRERLVLIHGPEVKSWNLGLEEQTAPFQPEEPRGDRIGAGLLACNASLDKGYWFVADSNPDGTIVHFFRYDDGQRRATMTLRGTDWSTGFLFDRSNMALFPRGAVFAVENERELRGYAWDEIVRNVGLRAHCF